MATPHLRIAPRIRVYRHEDIALGPGKAELLGHLDETGSLSEAARRMKMSYMKAWLLVQVMNRSFRKPLVVAERGGSRGGGATLTESGRRALALYREMEKAGAEAMRPAAGQLIRMLKPS